MLNKSSLLHKGEMTINMSELVLLQFTVALKTHTHKEKRKMSR
jgi:hypothetical protein